MALLKCPRCGESFADSYKTCPFCAEDDEYYNGRLKKRNRHGVEGRRHAPSILGPAMIVVIILILAFVAWIFFGDAIRTKIEDWVDHPQVSETVDQSGSKPVDIEPISSELALDVPTLTMAIGDSYQLNANGGGSEYTWTAGTPTVAAVTESGLVTAITTGSCVITVTDEIGTVASCTVTVVDELPEDPVDEPDTPDTPDENTVDMSKVKITYSGHELPASSEDGYKYDISIGNKESLTLAVEGTKVTPVWHVDIGGTVVSVTGNTITADQGKSSGRWSTLTCTLGDESLKIKVHVR